MATENKTILDIYNDDCLEVLRSFPDESIDLIITSPPYNLNIKYKGTYTDNKKEREYLWFIKTVMIELKRVLKPNGQIFLNIGYTNKSPLVDMKMAVELEDLFVLQNRITWVKNISIEMKDNDTISRLEKENNKLKEDLQKLKDQNSGKRTLRKKKEEKDTIIESFGHIKPINSKRYTAPSNETIFHYTKSGDVIIDRNSIGVPYKYKSNLKERNKKKKKTGDKKDCRDRGNTWYIPYETINSRSKDRKSHPATFPKKLVEMCIKFSGIDKNGIILDPFLGSGTTCYVSLDMGFKSIGIELSEEYYKDVIKDFEEKYDNESEEKEKQFSLNR